MNSIHSRLYDPAKDRRYGMLFFITMVIFLCLSALAIWAQANLDKLDIGKADLPTLLLQASPGMLILTIAVILRALRLNRTRQTEKFQIHNLSRDEILKARVKLVKTKS